MEKVKRDLICSDIDEYRKFIEDKAKLSISELIATPNCELYYCKGERVVCCDKCGWHCCYWSGDEQNKRRFPQEVIEKLRDLFDESTGYFTKDGCQIANTLGRQYMPIMCLKHICNPWEEDKKKAGE